MVTKTKNTKKKMRHIHYGTPNAYPFFIKFTDGKVTKTFKTKKSAIEYRKTYCKGKGTLFDRRW